MEKRPFTPQGLQDLINQLYALPDAELQSEATAIGIDFTLWTNNHFTLSSQQVDFLNAIDERFIAAAASNCQYFIAGRRPIKLQKPEQPAINAKTQEKERGKLVDLDKKSSNSYSPDTGYTTEEELIFSISYPELN